MHRRTFILSAPLGLAACGVTREEVLAPQSRLTLLTMKNTGSGNGAHTGLMINASQRVLWDPAGTFGHASIPERNDVHFGITPRIDANGPTPKAACTTHTSTMLGKLPGFESIRRSFFPNNLSDQFAKIPGVRESEYRENDADDKSIAAAEIDAALRNGQ